MSVELARQARRPYQHPQRKPELTQTIVLQEKVFTRASDPAASDESLIELSKTFIALGDHKRILRMKPAPKAIDTTKIVKRQSKTEPKPDVLP